MSQLKKLDRSAAIQIVKKLRQAAGSPERFFERLSGSEKYKLRAGDYRAIAKIYFSEKLVFVEAIDHRSRVYQK